jgi:hypothetical protein
MTRENNSIGDYVLASKYSDGDPCDHFCVGFISDIDISITPPRYMVIDGNGVNQRGNGFRKVEKITQAEGSKLIELMPTIGDKVGKSVWWHLAIIRGETNPVDPCGHNEDESHDF